MKIKRGVLLRDLTTFKIGGPADYFCVAEGEDDIRQAISFAKNKKIPVFILGGGSNVLVSDDGFRGLVLKINIKGISWRARENGEVAAEVGAGENWDDFVKETTRRGLWGLENLSGIPGKVGGAPVQNIGAYGAEAKETIFSVQTLNLKTSKLRRFSKKECRFGYRESFFKSPAGERFIIVKVVFRLSKEGSPKIFYKDVKNEIGRLRKKKITPAFVRALVLRIRKKKFPPLDKVGTAGSFFKNPVVSEKVFGNLRRKFPGLAAFPAGKGKIKISLAWILDKVLKLRGYEKGKAALYENQPLVLVNRGGASAQEVGEFAEEIRKRVRKATGVTVEPEVRFF